MKANSKVLANALMLAAVCAGVWAQTQTASKPAAKKKQVASSRSAVTAADVQSLKDAIAAQQQQIQQLTQQLQQNQQLSLEKQRISSPAVLAKAAASLGLKPATAAQIGMPSPRQAEKPKGGTEKEKPKASSNR